jgi:predicted Zn-dependent protease
MRYVPKKIKGNVNISGKNPLKEFFKLLCGLLFIAIISYIALGLAIDLIVPRIPASFEDSLKPFYRSLYAGKGLENSGVEAIRSLLQSLVETSRDSRLYTLSVVDGPRSNAHALPGNHILIYSALIKEIESEEELTFVLAHELGHFYYRDHLKSLGRRLVLMVISNTIFGQDNTLSKLIGNSLSDTEMRFSQKQERAADLFALNLLYAHYGNDRGALRFFEKAAKKPGGGEFFAFFSTHPHPRQRLALIKKKMRSLHLPDEPIPLDQEIKEMFTGR